MGRNVSGRASGNKSLPDQTSRRRKGNNSVSQTGIGLLALSEGSSNYLFVDRMSTIHFTCVFFLLNVIVKFLSSVNKYIRLFTGKSHSLPDHFYRLVSVQVCLVVLSFTFIFLFLKHPQVKSAHLLKIFADFVLK